MPVGEEGGAHLDDPTARLVVAATAARAERPTVAARAATWREKRFGVSPAEIRDVRGRRPVREEARGEVDPALRELVQEDRSEPRGLQLAVDRAVGRERLDLELEDVLQRDDVRLHPLHLGYGVHRREPSSIRSMWTIMSRAEETCWRIARTGRS